MKPRNFEEVKRRMIEGLPHEMRQCVNDPGWAVGSLINVIAEAIVSQQEKVERIFNNSILATSYPKDLDERNGIMSDVKPFTKEYLSSSQKKLTDDLEKLVKELNWEALKDRVNEARQQNIIRSVSFDDEKKEFSAIFTGQINEVIIEGKINLHDEQKKEEKPKPIEYEYTHSADLMFKDGTIVQTPEPGEGWEEIEERGNFCPPKFVGNFGKKTIIVRTPHDTGATKENNLPVIHPAGKMYLHEYVVRARQECAQILCYKKFRRPRISNDPEVEVVERYATEFPLLSGLERGGDQCGRNKHKKGSTSP